MAATTGEIRQRAARKQSNLRIKAKTRNIRLQISIMLRDRQANKEFNRDAVSGRVATATTKQALSLRNDVKGDITPYKYEKIMFGSLIYHGTP